MVTLYYLSGGNMKDNPLSNALDALDSVLAQQKLKLDILICGAFALQILGFDRGVHTLDVDTVMKIDDPKVLNLIAEIGKQYGLSSNWLNDQAASVTTPEDIFERAKKLDQWSSINAFVIDRVDLIKMKTSAFSIRREETSKDWDDLKLLSPTKQEIEAAIGFLRKFNAPPKNASKADIDNYKETIHDLRNLV